MNTEQHALFNDMCRDQYDMLQIVLNMDKIKHCLLDDVTNSDK